MNKKKIERRTKEDMPVLAICYDFDKTLSPDDMQAQGYIQSVGYDIGDFWKRSNALAAEHDMDQNLAYMYTMLETAKGQLLFKRKKLEEYGEKVTLFSGVEDWFKRISEYGTEKGVIVEHYIISSGLKEMIEGTAIGKNGVFKKIYASSFYYDEHGLAKWPAQVVNYTNKTQFLFRIEKGVLDVNDIGVNDFIQPEDMRVPFRNMVYIGDSDTDIPCMKLVNSRGGYSIGVYNADTQDKTKVHKMMRDDRIRYYAPADYTEGKELDDLLKCIINRTVDNEKLEEIHYKCKKEKSEVDKNTSEDDQIKTDLISSLENSRNFARTHTIITELKECKDWTTEEKELLFKIAIENKQVYYILKDADVNEFYQTILKDMKELSENAKKVKEVLEKNS